ncbi:tetratricopeptide repeat protein [Okeania sp. SIO2B3]|uniref:tetratricopeptide repeat protein n=1 Tax=Okeania sp. SIO2B3 TaxID=2607784 RepID=UPI0013C284C7|nr:glycosyltransferase 61 family protein [Okeania sp. SIO2B3]NET43630.1 DUF563 domain-containing protein [Okeania sp. SIO2B3]
MKKSENLSQDFFELGKQLEEQGKLDEAAKAYQKSIDLNPGDELYYVQFAKVLEKQKKYQELIQCYQKLIAINSKFFRYHLQLGNIFEKIGETVPAISHYLKSLELNPSSFWSYYNLGNLFVKNGEVDNGISWYQKSLSIFQQNRQKFLLHNALGNALMEQHRLDESIYHYELAISINPDSSESYFYLGLGLLKKLQYEDSIQNFIQALRIKPDYRQVYTHLGKAFELKGDLDNAVNCYNGRLPVGVLNHFCQTLPIVKVIKDESNKDGSVKFETVHPAYKFKLSSPKGLNSQVHPELAVKEVKVSETFVTFVRDGRAWLDSKNNVIYTSENHLVSEVSIGNTELILSSDRLPPLKKIGGSVCSLVTPGAGGGYYHWMIDLLPRIDLIYNSGMSLEKIDKFVVNRYRHPFQIETLQKIGISASQVIESESLPHISAENLIVPSFKNPALNVEEWAVNFLRRYFLSPTSNGLTKKRRIYISRNKRGKRKIINEEEVVNLLSKYQFETVILESMTVSEQASLMSETEAIVAPHGAGLTNIVFCNPGTKVIELFSSHVKPYYWSLSNCCNLEYYSYHDPSYNFSTEDGTSSVHSAKSSQQRNQEDIFVDISLLAELLSMANLL